jgi:hypothetical protein
LTACAELNCADNCAGKLERHNNTSVQNFAPAFWFQQLRKALQNACAYTVHILLEVPSL